MLIFMSRPIQSHPEYQEFIQSHPEYQELFGPHARPKCNKYEGRRICMALVWEDDTVPTKSINILCSEMGFYLI
jgi:hypothetical protein